MGYMTEDCEDAGVSPLLAWFIEIGIVVTIIGAVIIACFITDWWASNARGPARLRATATDHVSSSPLPIVPPSNFVAAVESRKAAMLAAEGRDLDLCVVVETSLVMSVDEVAGQAVELANRLRCGLKVRYKGQTVRAWPGMSRESFTKEYVEQVEHEVRKAQP